VSREFLQSSKRLEALDHPLYSSSPTLLCVEGLAAMVRGDLQNRTSSELTGCDNYHTLSFSPTHPIPPSAPNRPVEAQYVCTGLDIYLLREPDVMSAMALVHSRIRRVVFLEPDPAYGALGSRYSLHTMPALNHRFRVYHACDPTT
jgi:tRNA(Arg) A34 adenosine deaminase TadA